MRIDLNLGTNQTPDAAKVAEPETASGLAPKSELSVDVANPSADYVRAQTLTATLSQLPDVREEQVAALAEVVRSGNYAVTAGQTAEALMAHMAGRAAA